MGSDLSALPPEAPPPEASSSNQQRVSLLLAAPSSNPELPIFYWELHSTVAGVVLSATQAGPCSGEPLTVSCPGEVPSSCMRNSASRLPSRIACPAPHCAPLARTPPPFAQTPVLCAQPAPLQSASLRGYGSPRRPGARALPPAAAAASRPAYALGTLGCGVPAPTRLDPSPCHGPVS